MSQPTNRSCTARSNAYFPQKCIPGSSFRFTASRWAGARGDAAVPGRRVRFSSIVPNPIGFGTRVWHSAVRSTRALRTPGCAGAGLSPPLIYAGGCRPPRPPIQQACFLGQRCIWAEGRALGREGRAANLLPPPKHRQYYRLLCGAESQAGSPYVPTRKEAPPSSALLPPEGAR